MTLTGPSSDSRLGVTVTFPTFKSPVLPTVIPSITRCGSGNIEARRPPIFTGSLSFAETSFSICGM